MKRDKNCSGNFLKKIWRDGKRRTWINVNPMPMWEHGPLSKYVYILFYRTVWTLWVHTTVRVNLAINWTSPLTSVLTSMSVIALYLMTVRTRLAVLIRMVDTGVVVIRVQCSLMTESLVLVGSFFCFTWNNDWKYHFMFWGYNGMMFFLCEFWRKIFSFVGCKFVSIWKSHW